MVIILHVKSRTQKYTIYKNEYNYVFLKHLDYKRVQKLLNLTRNAISGHVLTKMRI